MMKKSRREFLKTTALLTGSLAISPVKVFSSASDISFDGFALHPFIEANPDAVFIMRTNVDVKTNATAMKQAGLDFTQSVLVQKMVSEGGIPLSNKVIIKPNLTCRNSYDKYPGTEQEKLEQSMGIVSDANFIHGMIESIQGLGVPSANMYMRERSCANHWSLAGFTQLATLTGVDLKPLEAEAKNLPADDLQWIDLPDGVWFRKIAYLYPVNAPDSFLINVAKFKSHIMGCLTLSAKNLQGTMAYPYVQHCRELDKTLKYDASHVNPTAKTDIISNYSRHVSDGIPRWDKTGDGLTWSCGLHQETWATRCIDNHLASKVGLHVIEGIYGRDGDGFAFGPHVIEGITEYTYAQDFMTNYIIFGKNAFHVDVIGHWLGGHEPGNVGLFHLAMERGAASHVNPENIAVYEWDTEGNAVKKSYTEFERYEITTNYLRRNYNGQNEGEYHLCNEEFDYSQWDPTITFTKSVKPEVLILNQNYPNPFSTYTNIQFTIPEAGNVKIEIFDLIGRTIDVLVDSFQLSGSHQVSWYAGNKPSGIYFCRMQYGGFTQTRKMQMIRQF